MQMSAYLFLWNPKQDTKSFANFARVLSDAESGKSYMTRWICPSRQPKNGDIAYLKRTGPTNNGIFAKGKVVRNPYEEDGTRLVRLSLDSFLPLGSEISSNAIAKEANYEKTWAPMASGTVIAESLHKVLQLRWPTSSSNNNHTETSDDGSRADELIGIEGKQYQRLVVHRTREQKLRLRKISDAIARNGRLICEVPGCGFDFARVYGEVGEGYAHVHHLHPLAKSDGARETHISDLAIVCANCHSMIHRDGECRELPSLILRA